MQGAQSENEAKQEIQQLHKELVEAQELARTSKQKCFELQGEIKFPLNMQLTLENLCPAASVTILNRMCAEYLLYNEGEKSKS